MAIIISLEYLAFFTLNAAATYRPHTSGIIQLILLPHYTCKQILYIYIYIQYMCKYYIYICTSTSNIHIQVAYIIYRVVGNWWYKRKGGDSTRKKKSKIWNKNFSFEASFSRKSTLNFRLVHVHFITSRIASN